MQGFDTVEANHRLGFEDDERDFRIGAGDPAAAWGFRGGAADDEQPAQGRDDGKSRGPTGSTTCSL
jgi:hypothetical protein